MITRFVEPVLCCAAIFIAALGVVLAHRAEPTPPIALPAMGSASRYSISIARDSLAADIAIIVAGDPFRLDRHPSSVAYRAALEGASAVAPPPAPPKPPLAIAGIVGGPPWAALLDGVPGRDGSVLVHAGDVVGALRIRAITRTVVTIIGMDTTWTLSLKHPWP